MNKEIQSNVLGLLRQRDDPDYVYSTIHLNPNETIEVILDVQYLSEGELPAILEQAHSNFAMVQLNKTKFQDFVTNHFLQELKSEWSEDTLDSEGLTEDEFRQCFKMTSILFWQSGDFVVHYNPENLDWYFGDHIVAAQITPAGEIKRIKLQ